METQRNVGSSAMKTKIHTLVRVIVSAVGSILAGSASSFMECSPRKYTWLKEIHVVPFSLLSLPQCRLRLLNVLLVKGTVTLLWRLVCGNVP